MTEKQRITLMADLWPAACKTQGWSKSDRELRLTVCSIALSFPISSVQDFGNLFYSDAPCTRQLVSTNDIDADTDFTRVKAILRMLADNLQGAQEIDQPQINKARQLRHVVTGQIACLALYHDNPQAYVQELIRDKFARASRVSAPSLDDLTDDPIVLRDGRRIPSQLRQLVMTLNGRLTKVRKAASHTEEQMKEKASGQRLTHNRSKCENNPCTYATACV